MFDEIIDLVKAELDHQDVKWGHDRILDSKLWITILGEEVGEVCRASLEHDPTQYMKELVQVAAVAIAAIYSLRLELEKDTQS